MSYQVLARKWRPQTFAEVVGQEHITRTLQNAILQNRIGHAYLFVGARGIGKTTTARIFAKAMNCRQGIVAEPCCACESCLEIAAGTSLDVIEIDGASHNKVDDIRDIRDNVQYTPSRSRYKIYIIDEVHMLTTAAWNALLKTLEEPPPHVKFLFATTEPHKVLPTIVSRCQRFDLKRIPAPLISARLRRIADQESIHVEDAALSAIARAADGGMRDAQSIFDQIIAFCGGLEADELIREQDVIDVFGLASGAELRQLAVSLLANDLDGAIGVVQELADHGRDLERVYADLVSFVRNVMISSVCNDPRQFLEASSSELEDLCAIGRAVTGPLVQRLLQGLVAQEWSFRSALNKRVYLEATLARVMLEAHSIQLEQVIEQLNRLRQSGIGDDIPAPRPPALPVIPPSPPAVPATDSRSVRVPAGTAPAPSIGPSPSPKPEKAIPEDEVRVEPSEPSPSAKPSGSVPAGEVPAEPSRAPVSSVPEKIVREDEAPVVKPPEPAPSPAPAKSVPEDEAPAEPVNPSPSSEPANIVPESEPPAEPSEPAAPVDDTPDFTEPDEDEEELSVADELQADEPAPASEPDLPAAAKTVVATAGQAEPSEGPEPAGVELSADLSPEELAQQLWQKLVSLLEATEAGRSAANWVRMLRPVSVYSGVLQLAYDETFPADGLAFVQSPETAELIAACYARMSPSAAGRVAIKRWIADVSDGHRSNAMRRAAPEVRARVTEKPFVKEIVSLFGGDVIDVRVQSGNGGK